MPPFKETSSADFPPVDTSKRLNIFRPAPPPDTELGTYRLLSPSAGVRVSPLCLGTMNLGTQWSAAVSGPASASASASNAGARGSGSDGVEGAEGPVGMEGREAKEGEEGKRGVEACYALLDAYFDAGGNFIDMASNYQDTQTEFIVGEWMRRRDNRDDIVLATKYASTPTLRRGAAYPGIAVNYTGNHRKSVKHSLEASLRRLQTTYIDILYVHWWDHTTSIPEVMHALDALVRAGTVLYLGVCDTPAWVVAGANEYARAHALAQFVVYQGKWSLANREIERDVLPMCRAYGLALVPCGVFGGGKFKAAQQLKEGRTRLRENMPPTEADIAASEALADVARQLGPTVSITAVALAWVRAKGGAYVFPVVGCSSVKQLEDNVSGLSVQLSPTQVAALDAAMPLHQERRSVGGRDAHYLPGGIPDSVGLNAAGHIRFVEYP